MAFVGTGAALTWRSLSLINAAQNLALAGVWLEAAFFSDL